MFFIELLKIIESVKWTPVLLVAILMFGAFLAWQTTNHLPTQIKEVKIEVKDLRTELKADIKDVRSEVQDLKIGLAELKGMLNILVKQAQD